MAELVQIAGTAIGFAIGGPIGGAIGGALGGALGRELFPEDPIQGPRLESLQLTTSTIGAVINQMDGNQRLAGQVIWLNEVREVKETDEVGGLFGIGGQETVQFRYFVDFAVGFAEGEIGAVRKIWFDNKLRYDVAEPITAESIGLPTGIFPAAFTRLSEQIAASRALDFDFYPGSETQLPDELIESVLGMGNASAYRGLCYIVFKNVEITDTRRIPQVTAELVKKPIFVEDEYKPLKPAEIRDWLTGETPLNVLNQHQYRYTAAGIWRDSLTEALDDAGSDIGIAQNQYNGWTRSLDNSDNFVAPYEIVDPEDRNILYLKFNSQITEPVHRYGRLSASNSSGLVCQQYDTIVEEVGPRVNWYWTSRRDDGDLVTGGSVPPGGGVFQAWPTSEDPPFADVPNAVFINNCIGGAAAGLSIRCVPDITIEVRRVPSCECGPCNPVCNPDVSFLPENPDFCVTPSGEVLPNVAYTLIQGVYKQLQAFDDSLGVQAQRPIGPVLDLTNPDDVAIDTESFWIAAYDNARTHYPDFIPAGLSYPEDYPVSVSQACRLDLNYELIDSIPTTLEEVVRRICLRHQYDLSEIDTSGLREIAAGELTADHVLIDGYSIRSAISGRAQLEQLRTYGFFDAVESDGKLKFVRRGLAAVTELGEDELGAFEQSRIPAISIERQQDVELPREVRVHYSSPGRDYLPAEQISARLTPLARNVVDLELAIAMSDDKAKQIADVVLYDAWTERNRYSTAISNQWLRLEPTDCISVPVEGQTERLRILTVDYTLPGLLALTAVRDDDGVYVSEAVGNGGGFVPQTPTLRGPTQAIYLDLPPLSQAHTDAGYYVAVRGLLDTWPGATILRSGDGGDTYSPARSINVAATVGSAVSALPDAPSAVADLGNTLTVDLFNGALQSITEATWYAGGNLAALRSGDVWELLQFRTATEISAGRWELTNLLRGRRGTEHATGLHAAGDAFVLLASPALLGLDVSNVGLTLPHKAVTAGTPIANTDPQDFTPRGEALMPWTPANLQATYTDNGDILISWQWRNRYGISLRSGATVPLSDVPEAGEVDVLIGGTVLRTIAVTSNSATYTAAQQTADSFTTGAFRVVQINPLIGRGRAAEVSL